MVKKCENTRNLVSQESKYGEKMRKYPQPITRSQGCGYFRIFSPYLDSCDINFEGRWPKLILNHNSVNSQQIWMLRGSKNSENSWEQSCQLRYTKTSGYTRAIP